jgi:phosphopantothenoylcysteine decarboxylase/phosphopantothenate--cysteine ligase
MKVIHAETTKIMRAAVLSELKSTQYSVFVATAAVADFEPEKVFESKVDTHTTSKLELKLKSTPKIIDEAKKTSPKTFLVAFKAEYKLSDKDLVNNAYKRLKTSHANLMVANDVGRQGVGFQTDTNEVFVINKNKRVIHLPLTSKQEISRKLLDIIVEEIRGKS